MMLRTYYLRGMIEVGNGGPGYDWCPGYSEDSEDGRPLYGWQTKAECIEECRKAGDVAVFSTDPNKRLDRGKSLPLAYIAAARKAGLR